MPATDSLGVDVTRADGTLVGSAVDPAQAVTLAAAIYQRDGSTAFVTQGETEIGWIGTVIAPPLPPATQMTIAATTDAEDAQQIAFSLVGAPAETGLDFGDGETETLPAGTTTATHHYTEPGTYRVVAVSGAEIADVYVSPGPAPVLPLQLLSLEPDHAEIGGPDLTLLVSGSGFQPGAVILFNEGEEATVFVSEQQVTTLVKPSTAGTPGSYPVQVRNPDGGVTNEAPFTFTQALPK